MQYPVIVFEGPDRVGKTTIANKLAEKLGTEVFMTNSKEAFVDKGMFGTNSSAIALFNCQLAQYLKVMVEKNMLTKPIIIYRSFMSERVYAKLLGRKTGSDYNNLTDMFLSSIGATIVLCDNAKTTGFNDQFLGDELILKSKQLYEQESMNTRCDILEIDTTEQNVDQYVQDIIEFVYSN